MNNSSQAREGPKDGFLSEASGFSSDVQLTGGVSRAGHLFSGLWFPLQSEKTGMGRVGVGEGEDDLQSLLWLPETAL